MLLDKKSTNKTSDLTSTFDAESRKRIGGRIRFIWERSGLKQSELAEKLGVSSVTLLNYMKGVRTPDVLFVNKLATELNICLEWILTGNGPMQVTPEKITHMMEHYVAQSSEPPPLPQDTCVDMKILFEVVEALEEILEDRGTQLDPTTKANVICHLCQLVIENKAQSKRPGQILRLVRGALAANE